MAGVFVAAGRVALTAVADGRRDGAPRCRSRAGANAPRDAAAPRRRPAFRGRRRSSVAGVAAACALGALATTLLPAADARAADPLVVDVVRVTREVEPPVPLSLVDERVEDEGMAGAELGLEDNATTGGFLGHEYALENVRVPEEEDIGARVAALAGEGRRLFLLDLERDDLLAAAEAAPEALMLNVRSADDALRSGECRANVLHVPPSRAMLADALAQYLAWKRWTRVVIVTGRHPEDAAYAAALERAAGRFGLKVAERKDWTSVPGARRTDSGHHSAQQEIPAFARFEDHDVVLLADEGDEFGEYFPYRVEVPRPIAGTQGLTSTAWHRSHEQWGGTQIQRRFADLAGRDMTPRDYAHWVAMRALGEAVTNTASNDPATLREFLLSDRLTLAAFKGVPLSFRAWNGQLRQPVLVVGPRMLVTVSPQEGFLHERTELDTLGLDEPESGCERFADG